MIPVIVIYAPTACGKTALATNFFGRSSFSVLKQKCEVVSADSQAVYRNFNIGTAKPSQREQEELPHHLIDIADPEMQFGLGDFLEHADRLCAEIYARGKIPLVLGGTGFYIRNFILGSPVTPESDPFVRKKLKERLEKEGNEVLFNELLSVDREYAAKINVNDGYRICRALEVFQLSGKPLSSFALPSQLRKEYDFCTIILNRDRKDLYERIDLRVEKMFEEGLVQEVEALKKKGYTKDTPAMKAIGYSEFFTEGLSLEQIKEKIKHDSHRYAKKQQTFMAGIPGAVSVHADDHEKVFSLISDFILQKYPCIEIS